MKMKPLKPEAQFSSDFGIACSKLKCSWTVIPDTKMINKSNRHHHKELKRPCDGVFNSETATRMLELKANTGRPLPHQIMNCVYEDQIRNNSYLFIKKLDRKPPVFTEYRVFKYRGLTNRPEMVILFTCNNLADLIFFLQTVL